MRTLRILFITITLVVISLAIGMVYFVRSENGIVNAVSIANYVLPGKLTVTNPSGVLAHEIQFDKLSYQTPEMTLTIRKLYLKWQLSALLHGLLKIQNLQVADILIEDHSKASANTPGYEDIQVPELPIRVKIQQLSVQHVRYVDQGNSYNVNDIKAKVLSLSDMNITIRLPAGSYKIPERPDLAPIVYDESVIRTTVSRKGLSTEGTIVLNHQQQLKINLSLPKWRIEAPVTHNQPIQGTLSLSMQDLSILEALSEYIQNPQGQLEGSLYIDGTLGAPKINGKISLSNGAVTVPETGITFSPISMEITTSHNEWRGKASIGTGDKSLQLEGKGSFLPNISGDVSITGNNFQVVDTSEYKIAVAPDLKVNFLDNALQVQGEVTVPKGLIKPETFTQTETLTNDAVFIEQEATHSSSPLDAAVNVSVKMGDDVKLDIKGLQGNLHGAFQLQQKPGGSLDADGSLFIKDGKFTAYGQALTIKTGELLFTGGSIYNPGIRVQAVRSFGTTGNNQAATDRLLDFSSSNVQAPTLSSNTTVGVEITGRLQDPKTHLFSIPAGLSQADILSMLVLGKPAAQASESGGQLLMSAIAASNLGSGSKGQQLISQLQKKTGLDFSMQSSSNFNQSENQVNDSTSVSIGKAISKRIYVSYNIGVLQTNSNVFTLKYLLNRFFKIQITASDTGNGVDVLYTSSKD